MHSIRTKITILTVSAILICSVLIGTLSAFTVKTREEQNAQRLLNTICASKLDKINSHLNIIENSVDSISRFVYSSFDTVVLSDANAIGATGSGRSLRKRTRTAAQQEALDAYLQEHLAATREMCRTIAANNSSILGYYYRINPELSDHMKGFWYSRQNNGQFKQLVMTEISEYKPDDFAHVGWYYLPLERGRPSWLDPYENKNLGETVVSYIMPLYKSGTFIGEIGMDISYSTLVNQIKELKILESGYAFLTDRKGKIVYHPQLSHGTLLGDVSEEMKAAGKSSDTRLIRYTNNGVEKEAAWNTLSNELILFVSAPVSEISAGWRNLSWLTLATAAATVALFIILTLSLVRKITNPLVQLVHASQQISEGNYNIDLNYEGDDEIGILTKSFQQMVNHMRVFISDLNSKAFRDALTGVRNKGAFDIFLMDKDENIRQSDPKDVEDFAVVMFDCNELKTINDTYGHEKGDLYLQNACRTICKVYSHSPVFRIGGDEFVAILQKEDWKMQAELEQQFTQAMADANAAAASPWDRVNVAIGTANYNPETDPDMESVFRRADVLMYENKKQMKEANTKWMEQ